MSSFHSLITPFLKWLDRFTKRLSAFTAKSDFTILLSVAVVFFLIIFVSALSAPKESEISVVSSTETPSSSIEESFGDFPSAAVYNEAALMGFSDYETWKQFKASGFESKEAYEKALAQGVTSKKVWGKSAKSAIGDFPSAAVYNEANSNGFSDYEAWKKFKASGFSSKDEYTENVSRGIGTSKKLIALEAKAGKLGMNIRQYLMHIDIKSRCKTRLNYRSYMRHPEKFENVGFKIKGSISQVIGDGFLMQTEYNSFINTYSGDAIYVQMPFSVNVFNPVEDDVITLYGFGLGVQEYETVLGAMNRVPMFQAGTVDLHN
jgi:hypothetical protein